MEKYNIEINEGIILGDDVREILEVLPQLKDMFEQRKQYDEYYFRGEKIEIENISETLYKLARLHNGFKMYENDIRIMVHQE